MRLDRSSHTWPLTDSIMEDTSASRAEHKVDKRWRKLRSPILALCNHHLDVHIVMHPFQTEMEAATANSFDVDPPRK